VNVIRNACKLLNSAMLVVLNVLKKPRKRRMMILMRKMMKRTRMKRTMMKRTMMKTTMRRTRMKRTMKLL